MRVFTIIPQFDRLIPLPEKIAIPLQPKACDT